MKRIALMTALVFAAAAAAKAATVETMSAELQKAGFTVQTAPAPAHAPQPGVPQPVYQQPGQPGQQHGYPPPPGHQQPGQPHHPGYPPPPPGGYNPQPWQPGQPQYPSYPPVNPGHPTYPPQYPGQPGYPPQYPPTYPPTYPPVQPPYYPPPVQMQQFRFESANFVFGSDARQSMDNAAAALQRAGYAVLEKRNNFTAYTLVFLAPSNLKVQKFVSGVFVFGSDAQRAADECVKALESQGKVILERNVSGTTFTVSYLASAYGDYLQQQTYQSGNFVFGSDAARSMEETAAALKGLGAVILEKRLTGTTYTIVYLYTYKLESQNYASGVFVFGSDAARSMNETAEALKRINGVIVMEKRLTGTTYNIVFLAPYRLQTQKYVSGVYTFSSDAQRAAAETAAAFASQGMIVLEKNVAGTQFTITYVAPYAPYPQYPHQPYPQYPSYPQR